ncbi:dTDP-4-dehydrorhamnose 3,5-epimerase family protein [Aeromonas sp. R6-2]|uniref:dTDP-4-dehydrorhamnose 3,5-epimerase family protein n=1 Tax=Aeromonas sp. R6-2 TaxID=3138472 RepID=UPI0034A421EC
MALRKESIRSQPGTAVKPNGSLKKRSRSRPGKLIHVLAGCVFDVVVDLRPDSASFGRWVGTRLSATRPSSLWIPPGFAHGFYVTSESATLFYQCTDYYCSEYDRAIHWADPTLAIDWPLVENVPPLLSDKDNQAPFFDFSLNKQS